MMKRDTRAALREMANAACKVLELTTAAVIIEADASDVTRLRSELGTLWNAIDNFEAHAERDYPGTGTIPGPEAEEGIDIDRDQGGVEIPF